MNEQRKKAEDADTSKARVYILDKGGERFVEEFLSNGAALNYYFTLRPDIRAAFRNAGDVEPVEDSDYLSAGDFK
jgi:hypothetical protein